LVPSLSDLEGSTVSAICSSRVVNGVVSTNIDNAVVDDRSAGVMHRRFTAACRKLGFSVMVSDRWLTVRTGSASLVDSFVPI
jgi:hypothetical protein